MYPSTSCRYCLHVAYYGTGYIGWQRQQRGIRCIYDQGSVQEVIEAAVTEVSGSGQRVNVTGVSRTDAGTHALYQYGFIRLDSELTMTLIEFKDRVNAKLDTDRVVVLGVTVPTTSPSRIRSRCKKYIYYLQQGHRPDLKLGKYSWFLGRRIDIEQIRQALKFIEGTHDFRPFSKGLSKPMYENISTTRTIISTKVVVRRNVDFSLNPKICGSGKILDSTNSYNDLRSAADSKVASADAHNEQMMERGEGGTAVHFICIEIVANGFLRHMVRRIIGTLRPIGEGNQQPVQMQRVLDGSVQPGPSAPTKGLWLHRTWLTQDEYDVDCAGNLKTAT
ncbi:hypothetical protein CCR75_000208 [Bremia lactucae]|uniref:tRNA pseudouridine synthase n=1 Tax=Bremia lactucae TaxID=4779 RepID=A0A976IB22_BRELC|nr:hypothetical protein CCR75_000208 [Bremia lactucae]